MVERHEKTPAALRPPGLPSELLGPVHPFGKPGC